MKETEKVKKCPKCLQSKSYSSFYTRKTTKDGLSGYCIECSREVARVFREKYKERNVVSVVGRLPWG